MDFTGWLDRIEAVERRFPNKRIVQVWIPGGLPKIAWNVSNGIWKGHTPYDGENVPHMRRGLFGSFLVVNGAFRVKFNDSSEITS